METSYATSVGIFEAAPDSNKATTLGLLLNLLNVFLFMTNYNVVIPTLDVFCEKLNIPSSTAGTVIGCADFTAIAGALVYSKWTNSSFRLPMLYSSIICCIGNLLVTLSYDMGGLPLLLAGRLLTGAGNARVLNRRYIADFVSLEVRTSASIAFVAASAGGMAMGPFLAVPLSQLLQQYGDSIKIAGLTINVVTVEGWLMVGVWIIFWLTGYFFFKEPLGAQHNAGRVATDVQLHGHDDVQKPLLTNECPRTLEPVAEGSHCEEEGIGSEGVQLNRRNVGFAVGESKDGAVPVDSPDRERDVDAETTGEGTKWQKLMFVLKDEHTLPSVTCMVALFVLKLVQQGTVSTIPLFTMDFYAWDQGQVGLFMTFLSLSTIPINFSIAAITAVVRYLFLKPTAVCAPVHGSSGSGALSNVHCMRAWTMPQNRMQSLYMCLCSQITCLVPNFVRCPCSSIDHGADFRVRVFRENQFENCML